MKDDIKPRQADSPGVTPAAIDSTPTSQEKFLTPADAAKQDQMTKRSPKKLFRLDHLLAAKNKRNFKLHLTRWQLIALGTTLFVLINAAAAWHIYANRIPADDNWRPDVSAYKKPEPTTIASRLTGMEVTLELNALPTTAVMLENSPDARPQSGLKEAGVVFEAIAEGGITRFLALYLESQPEHIGPVRSVRPYYLDFLVPFDAPIAHVGGSAEALAQIRSENIKDLDQFHNSGAYHRRNHRYAPHNMYTSRAKLLELQNGKGFTQSTFTGFARKQEKKSETPNATSIDFNISSMLYNVHYDYDAESNSYKRVLGGKPHTDEQTGAQLQPKVVLALIMPRSNRGIYSVYQTAGTGKVYVFQDGVVAEGAWHKASRATQLTLTDPAGTPLTLNPGQTWITLASEAGMVTYR